MLFSLHTPWLTCAGHIVTCCLSTISCCRVGVLTACHCQGAACLLYMFGPSGKGLHGSSTLCAHVTYQWYIAQKHPLAAALAQACRNWCMVGCLQCPSSTPELG